MKCPAVCSDSFVPSQHECVQAGSLHSRGEAAVGAACSTRSRNAEQRAMLFRRARPVCHLRAGVGRRGEAIGFTSRARYSAREAILSITQRLRPLPSVCDRGSKGAVAARLALATQAAQLNSSATRTPYRAPSDHDFREPTSPIKWVPQAKGRDFQAKFVLPSNQDIRRRTARDQDGFFGAAPGEDVLSLPLSPPFRQQLLQQEQLQLAIKAQTSRSPPKSSPSKPEFTSRVTHTSRKSANKALRLEIILDQEGLLPQLQEIRQHRYRDEVRPTARHHQLVQFLTLSY